MPPEIYQRYMEQQKNKPQTPQVSISIGAKWRNTIFIGVVAIVLVVFGLWTQHGKDLEKAQAVAVAREKLIDIRFRESVAHQDSICKWENKTQLLLEDLDAALKYTPYVEIRKKYVDLSLPDAIDVFDGTDYPE